MKLPVAIFEHTARNERWIVLAALSAVIAVGLFVTLRTGDFLMTLGSSDMPSGMASVSDMSSGSPEAGSLAYAAFLFVMWWAMMLAMMLPSAAPAILTYGAVSRKQAENGAPPSAMGLFTLGYAVIWTGFSIAAVALQLVMQNFVPLTGMMAVTSAILGGALLIGAGLYQLSPLKYACLHKCQAPLMFFARNWRKGPLGALRMGLSHGAYCLGCCWVLMGLLFYGGVMELRWIVGLALYVAAEKLIPTGDRLARSAGILLIGWGFFTVYQAFA